jgi:predicted nuclease of predicted toxin-antitoxin system
MAPSLYLDEHVDLELADRLRADGFDILTTQEAGRRGAADEDQLAYATSLGRIIFTHDMKDFRPISIRWSAERRPHAGIVYTRNRSLDQVSASLRRRFELYTPDQVRNVTMGLPVD